MQSTNFQHLQNRWPQLYEHANSAEQYVHTDPHTAIIKLRCFAEQLVGILYREFDLPCERNDGLFEKIKSSVFLEVVDKSILEKLNAIRILGNKALHKDYLKPSADALALLREAYLIGQWIFKTYSGVTDDEYPSYVEPIHPDVSVNLLNNEKKGRSNFWQNTESPKSAGLVVVAIGFILLVLIGPAVSLTIADKIPGSKSTSRQSCDDNGEVIVINGRNSVVLRIHENQQSISSRVPDLSRKIFLSALPTDGGDGWDGKIYQAIRAVEPPYTVLTTHNPDTAVGSIYVIIEGILLGDLTENTALCVNQSSQYGLYFAQPI